jgi:hypothetical protein
VLFSGKNFAILEYFPVPSLHGRVGRTTTRFFGVVVLANRQMCRKPIMTKLNSAQPYLIKN